MTAPSCEGNSLFPQTRDKHSNATLIPRNVWLSCVFYFQLHRFFSCIPISYICLFMLILFCFVLFCFCLPYALIFVLSRIVFAIKKSCSNIFWNKLHYYLSVTSLFMLCSSSTTPCFEVNQNLCYFMNLSKY